MSVLDGWRYCPRCAGRLSRGEGFVRCDVCGEIVWANPVPGAQALIEQDGRLLLGLRRPEPRSGYWDLPGGFLDETEHPRDALVREVREETGLEVVPGELVLITMDPYDGRTILSLTWTAEPVGGEARAADDLAELRWFAPDELPSADAIAFPGQIEALTLWRARREEA